MSNMGSEGLPGARNLNVGIVFSGSGELSLPNLGLQPAQVACIQHSRRKVDKCSVHFVDMFAWG